MNIKFPISNIYESISSAALDPAVGIRIVPLAGDDAFSFYAAELGPHRKVAAHYHSAGLELYQIVEGNGVIHIGKPIGAGKTDWISSAKVRTGDCFAIQAGEVHQLINDQEERLIVLFGCPKSHLSHDRTIVKGYGEM